MQLDLMLTKPPIDAMDFHIHSTFSDGSLTPTQLAQNLHAIGVQHWSLTDHDTLDGVVEAQQVSDELGLTFYAGIEITTRWQVSPNHRFNDVHIVGLGIKQPEHLSQLMAQQQQFRGERAEKIAQLLEQILKTALWDDILEMVNGQPQRVTRSHFARWLVEHQVVTRPQQAFDRFLSQGKRAYVPIEAFSISQAVNAITESGGISVLAHPTRYQLSSTHIRHLIAYFKQQGGHGLELPSYKEPLTLWAMVEKTAMEQGLLASYGSDYHGSQMPWVRLGHTPKQSLILPSVLSVLTPN